MSAPQRPQTYHYSARNGSYSGDEWIEPPSKPFLLGATQLEEVKSQFDHDDEDKPRRLTWKPKQSSPQNGPKPVIRGTANRFFLRWLIHFPAVATTGVLIWISHMQFFWYPESGAQPFPQLQLTHTVISNLLQLASKIHEIMIVASLASLTLAMFKRRLVGKGVRLGFLTGGYRVGDLAYLVHGSFWKQGRDVSLHYWEIGLAGFLVFTTLMSTVVGPASAILLVPSLGRYDLYGAFKDIKMPLIYGMRPEEAWPHRLNSSLFESIPECNTTEALYTYWCPVGGFSDIWNWAEGFRYAGLTNNITFQHPSTELRRRLQFTEHMSEEDGSVMLFTTPSSSSMTTIGLFTNYIARKPIPIGSITETDRYQLITTTPVQQPFVHGKCVVYDRDDLLKGKSLPYFPVTALNCYGDSGCLRLQQEKPVYRSTVWNNTEVRVETVYDLHSYANGTSGGAMLISGILPYIGQDSKQKLWVYTCSYLSRWVPTTLSLDPSVSSMLESNYSSVNDMRAMFEDTSPSPSQVLQVDPSWMDQIDPQFNITKMALPKSARVANVSMSSPIRLIIDQFLDSRNKNGTTVNYMDTVDGNSTKTEVFLAKVFGVVLTDSMARTASQERAVLVLEESPNLLKWVDLKDQSGYRSGIHRIEATGNETWPALSYWNDNMDPAPLNQTVEQLTQDFRKMVQVDFTAKRSGYGSGQWSKTLQFALIMMYVYLAIVSTYGLVVFSSHASEALSRLTGRQRVHLRSVATWGDLQDLVVLALRSNPPTDVELTHVGAGVRKTSDVWNKVIKIRVDTDDTLQLVLHEDKGMQPPKKNLSYS
ncbi:hypothetical protein CCHL11_07221 [Colletotrichum chlorophyti]|uniref:Uncharacterized protein n=1 Tax=Colletotrichum chlorophyti TaxID=708187 RepID=A0A1Q8RXA0_9PEZI|nr:hypothetical protein CCHL11_07221 [Colletotrichum chlorophyti]